MKQDGMFPTVVTETSPDNFQVWITTSTDELPIPMATKLAKLLEQRYSMDTGSADAYHLGRLPGLRNKKPKYQTYPGDGGPLVKLVTARNVPTIPNGIKALITEAQRLIANGPLAPPSAPLGGRVPPTTTDIDLRCSKMTPDDARDIYDAELQYQAKRNNWKLPITMGQRSEADHAIAVGLRILYGYEPEDIANVLTYGSEKAKERGMNYVKTTVKAAFCALNPIYVS